MIGFIGRILIEVVGENCIGESYICKMSDGLRYFKMVGENRMK